MASLAAPQRPVLCAFLYPPQFLTTHAVPRRLPTRSILALTSYPSSSSSSSSPSYPPLPSRRPFTQSAQLQLASPKADRQQRQAQKMQEAELRRYQGREPSMTRMSKEQTARLVTGNAAFDVGLFPNTLVMPTGAALPGLLSAARLRLEWQRLRTRAMDLASLLAYKFFSGARPRPRLRPADVADVARRLHHDMWSAFAAGDAAALGRMCAQGLARDLSARIANRPRTQARLDWKLHHYNGRIKVVSHRAASMPNVEKLSFRQAVVRIRSRQSLDKAGAGEAAEDTGKDVDEYFVIQKKLAGNTESEWHVWGTTQESDITPIISGAS